MSTAASTFREQLQRHRAAGGAIAAAASRYQPPVELVTESDLTAWLTAESITGIDATMITECHRRWTWDRANGY